MEGKNQIKNKGNKKKRVTNMVDVNPTISIITLNVNGLNAPVKRESGSKTKTQLMLQSLTTYKLLRSEKMELVLLTAQGVKLFPFWNL